MLFSSCLFTRGSPFHSRAASSLGGNPEQNTTPTYIFLQVPAQPGQRADSSHLATVSSCSDRLQPHTCLPESWGLHLFPPEPLQLKERASGKGKYIPFHHKVSVLNDGS